MKLKLKEKRELIGLLTQNVNILKYEYLNLCYFHLSNIAHRNQSDQNQFNAEMHKLNEMQKELSYALGLLFILFANLNIES